MWLDWVSNPGPLTYESGALPIVQRGLAYIYSINVFSIDINSFSSGSYSSSNLINLSCLTLYLRNPSSIFYNSSRTPVSASHARSRKIT